MSVNHDHELHARAAEFAWIWDSDAPGSDGRDRSNVQWRDLQPGIRRLLNILLAGERTITHPEAALPQHLLLMLGQDHDRHCDWWHPVTHQLFPWPSEAQAEYVPDSDVILGARLGLLSPIGQRRGRMLEPSKAAREVWTRG